MSGLFRRASVKLYGAPPPRDAARSVKLRYVRQLQLRGLPFVVPLAVVYLIFTPPTWVLIVLAVGAVVALENLISLTVRIRRAERRELRP
jgi:CHASE1-domain containing sensor protein